MNEAIASAFTSINFIGVFFCSLKWFFKKKTYFKGRKSKAKNENYCVHECCEFLFHNLQQLFTYHHE
jgi:hypothetical protein